MAALIHKILAKELKNYITSYKFCKISNSCCLIEGKFGNLSIDLSEFEDATSCHLTFRRVSGNGLLSINGSAQTITSKISQNISIDLINNKIINILRPASGIGHIELSNINIYSSLEVVNVNLKSILKNCKTSSISNVDDRIFANESSFIECAGLSAIETNPDNMYIINNDRATFLGLCEITNILINDSYSNIKPKTLLEKVVSISDAMTNSSEMSLLKKISNNSIFNFDGKEFISNNNVNIFNEEIVINRSGSVKINLPLEKNRKYALIINAKNIKGNGKVNLRVNNSNLDSVYFIKNKILKIPIKTLSSDTFDLEISRYNSCTGQVLISKVSILEFDDVFKDEDLNNNIKTNNVAYNSKQFATISLDNFTVPAVFEDIVGTVNPLTFSANCWLNKIKPLFPNLKIKSLILDGCQSNNIPDIIISDLKQLKSANKIWLEEFQDEAISTSKLNILKSAKVVVSSSLPNVQLLRNEYNINMLYAPKLWPYINVKPNNDDYVLYFNRDYEYTQKLIENYSKEYNKLVIVGMRGNFPNFITAYGDCLNYPELFGLIMGAKAIVDLPRCTHYMSAALDIALMAGIPIITSNQWLSISKPQTYMVRTELKNDEVSFNVNDVISSIKKISNKKEILINESYNLNLYGAIKTVMDY